MALQLRECWEAREGSKQEEISNNPQAGGPAPETRGKPHTAGSPRGRKGPKLRITRRAPEFLTHSKPPRQDLVLRSQLGGRTKGPSSPRSRRTLPSEKALAAASAIFQCKWPSRAALGPGLSQDLGLPGFGLHIQQDLLTRPGLEVLTLPSTEGRSLPVTREPKDTTLKVSQFCGHE